MSEKTAIGIFVGVIAIGLAIVVWYGPRIMANETAAPGESYEFELVARATSTGRDETTLQLAPASYGSVPNASAFLSVAPTAEAGALFGRYVAEKRKFKIRIEVVP